MSNLFAIIAAFIISFTSSTSNNIVPDNHIFVEGTVYTFEYQEVGDTYVTTVIDDEGKEWVLWNYMAPRNSKVIMEIDTDMLQVVSVVTVTQHDFTPDLNWYK